MVQIFSSNIRSQNEKRNFNSFHFVEEGYITIRTNSLFFEEQGRLETKEKFLFWISQLEGDKHFWLVKCLIIILLTQFLLFFEKFPFLLHPDKPFPTTIIYFISIYAFYVFLLFWCYIVRVLVFGEVTPNFFVKINQILQITM